MQENCKKGSKKDMQKKSVKTSPYVLHFTYQPKPRAIRLCLMPYKPIIIMSITSILSCPIIERFLNI